MPNVAGPANSFFYQDANATNWSASLQDLQDNAVFGEDDPDFEHVGPSPANDNNHEDAAINYITGNGSKWTSKCQSHSPGFLASGGQVTFNFAHFQYGSTDLDHESDYLQVIDWDGSIWNITVQPMPPNVDQGKITLNIAPAPAVGQAPPVAPPPPEQPHPYSPPRDL
jgi:hypothetical protein